MIQSGGYDLPRRGSPDLDVRCTFWDVVPCDVVAKHASLNICTVMAADESDLENLCACAYLSSSYIIAEYPKLRLSWHSFSSISEQEAAPSSPELADQQDK
jgi:hypothetical protein